MFNSILFKKDCLKLQKQFKEFIIYKKKCLPFYWDEYDDKKKEIEKLEFFIVKFDILLAEVNSLFPKREKIKKTVLDYWETFETFSYSIKKSNELLYNLFLKFYQEYLVYYIQVYL